MLLIYQIILLSLSAYFIGTRTLSFLKKEKNQSVYKILLTYLIWIGISLVSLFPAHVHPIIQFLGLGENYITLIFLVFVAIFVILFKILSIIERIEKNISDIVRKEALKDLLEKHK